MNLPEHLKKWQLVHRAVEVLAPDDQSFRLRKVAETAMMDEIHMEVKRHDVRCDCTLCWAMWVLAELGKEKV